MILLVFIVCPFIALIWACLGPRRKLNCAIIILFWGLIGLTRRLVISEDVAVTTLEIEKFSQFDYRQFFTYKFVTDWKENVNFLYWNLFYFLSKLKYTAVIWSVIMMLSCVILLYCYRLQSNHSVRNCIIKNRKYIIGYFIIYMFFLPISSYGTKFYVAAMLFMTGLYLYTYKEKMIGLLIASLSCLSHYSFLYPLFIGLLYYFGKNQTVVIKIALIILLTFVAYLVSPVFLSSGIISEKMEFYSDIDNRLEWYSAKAIWILSGRYLIALYSVFVLLYIRSKRINDKKTAKVTYFLTLFAVTLIPLTATPDALDRFSRFFSFLMIIHMIRILHTTTNVLPHWLLNVGVFVFSYHIMVSFFMRMFDWEMSIFYSNLLSIIDNSTLTTYIKMY